MSVEITVINGSSGMAENASPALVSALAANASVPMMFAGDDIVPNDGATKIAMFAPVGGALPGEYTKFQSTQGPIVDLAANYTVGADYYMQPNKTLTTAPTAFYVGTATNKITLMPNLSTAAKVAAENAPAPAPDAAITSKGVAASATDQLLKTSDVVSPAATTYTTAPMVGGYTGTVATIYKTNGVHFYLLGSAAGAAFTIVHTLTVIAGKRLPAIANGTLINDNHLVAGTWELINSAEIRLTMNAGHTGGFNAGAFLEYL